MISQGGRANEKGLEGGFLGIFDFPVLVTGIQVLVKEIAEVNLVEGVPLTTLKIFFLSLLRLFRIAFIEGEFAWRFGLNHFLEDGILHQFLVEHLAQLQLIQLEQFYLLEQGGSKSQALREPEIQ
jgi:hypothetical protein